jgi:hypothetical protein
VRSYNLAYHYPLLEKAFDQHGLQTLEVCFLGPAVWYRGGNGYFFARWQDGSVVMLGDRVFMAEISTVAASVVAVTFGVEDTFVFTYVTNKGTISHVWHLGGYYKQLGEILRNNNNTFTIEVKSKIPELGRHLAPVSEGTGFFADLFVFRPLILMITVLPTMP